MNFSIVIPSYNGASKLPVLLETIICNDLSNGEIIVVLDGSTDNSETLLKKTTFKNLVILNQPNSGRANARNAGAKIAKGHIIFFIDDDMGLKPDSIKEHLSHHKQHPGSILIGKVTLDLTKLNKDFDFYILNLLYKWETNSKSKTLIDLNSFKFTTQHLSIPKNIFDLLGGFDNRLTDAEDYDLGMRALMLKVPIYYDPDIVAFHHDFPTCEKYIKRQIEYKRSHIELELLEKQYSHNLFPSLRKPSLLRRAVSSIFTGRNWINSVDNEKLMMIPKKIRYKLYSEIIYAHTLKGMGMI